MPQRPLEKPSNPRAVEAISTLASTSPSRTPLLIVGAVLASISIVLAVVAWMVLAGPKDVSKPAESQPVQPAPPPQTQPPKPTLVADKADKKEKPKTKKPAKNPKPQTAVSDTKSLWVSPTHGSPLNLGYLSPGAQIIGVLRPHALLSHPEAEKIRAALGPEGQRGIEAIERVTIAKLGSIDQLIIGAEANSGGEWLVTFVVRTEKPIPRDALLARLPGATEKTEADQTYWLANDRAYYLPKAGDNKVLVIAPVDAMSDIIDLAGNPPPLRRDIERLLDHTDADRHITIIIAPNSLFSEGQSLFAGELERLRAPLFWFLGDELSGAALSMNWGENFFLELVATPKLDTTPEKAARIFTQRCTAIPDKLQQYVATLNLEPYSNEIVSRFPAMVRKLSIYTRSGFDPDHAVLRCYLPVVAGHNLLMAAELTLAEPPGNATQVAGVASVALSLHDRLAKVTSLKFAKDTLEAALQQLSQDIDVPIVIRGPDLQSEGITKNQSFGIDLENKPAEEILVQILRLANPDKSATGPADPRQKLVYVVEQKSDKTEQIVVTTRGRAKDRKKELPTAFRAARP
jgi:hypothetical protein